jgi:hypothetical protein
MLTRFIAFRVRLKTPYKTYSKLIIQYYLIFTPLLIRLELEGIRERELHGHAKEPGELYRLAK